MQINFEFMPYMFIMYAKIIALVMEFSAYKK